MQDAFDVWGEVAKNNNNNLLWVNMKKLMAKARSLRELRISGVSFHPSVPSPDPANISSTEGEHALSKDGMSSGVPSNLDPESLPEFYSHVKGSHWLYDNFDDLDNWVAGDWSGCNWEV